MRLPYPPLLLITDRNQARGDLGAILAQAFAAGCRWASLREKDLPPHQQVALARELYPLARRFGAALMFHGKQDLAQQAGVDGVHLPAGGDPAAARALLGPQALIGISVHSVAEAGELAPSIADYAIAGPVYETASKPGYGPALGPQGLAAITAATSLPVLAIGGVTPLNTREVLAAGAAGVAVMGGVMRAACPSDLIGGLISSLEEYVR